MNYYNHHIGDYAKDTAHLTMLEDAAYRRMLDLYYSSERPLPLDRGGLYRLVRARSKDERKAVDTILEEFFHLGETGWHQSRCDEEIIKAKESSQENEAKKENEKERQRRHRERRRQLFQEIREYGEVPKWDTPTDELETLLSRLQSRTCHGDRSSPETDLQRLTNSQEPISSGAKRASRLDVEELPEEWAEYCRKERPDLSPAGVFLNFKDYWSAKPGKDGTKLNWFATWRMWVRNQRHTGHVQRPGEVAL